MSAQHVQQLDKAQAELNALLVQVGRIFSSAKSDGPAAAAAQASKLKGELPGRTERYHEALDKIDNEIQLAQWTLERDLAILREKAGQAAKPAAVPMPALDDEPATLKDVVQQPQEGKTEPQEAETSEAKPAIIEPAPSSAAHSLPLPAAEPANEGPSLVKQEAAPESVANDEKPKLEDTKALEPKLNVDTTKASSAAATADGDERPPDTGVMSTNADLDSLFNDGNDTASGGASGDNNDFNFDANVAEGMDFADVFGDNDTSNNDVDLGALLPGVHDYANAGPDNGMKTDGGMNIFDEFTTTDGPTEEGNAGQDIDFMDFDFDQFTTDPNANTGNNNAGDDDVFNFD
ncbi:hypothetical protein Tdes44962_MAKER07895 [Teratosphaeria destructans]|uniref:Uncharacterized protein n=1 Tax=Teratosphaeria destructans TaxID=418781 RepID=A0A9W7SY71_9PEZI|nr:hypothetical protein Tdes44962_MAKER07895 [Teratosphaeria destructans]